jgi:hypothetical protein
VAAHIDREAFSIMSQLGFVPPELNLDALEITRHMSLVEALEHFNAYKRFPFYTASDAHDLKEIGVSPTRFRMGRSGMKELRRALLCDQGRAVIHNDVKR